ncbi:hypothetical protein [Oceanithermus sp.]
MGEYQDKLRELTQDEVVSQLEGNGGLLALTRSELFFIGPDGAQRAALREIKKVVGGKGGVLQVVGDAGPLIEAPVQAFQVDELRLFFESVKAYVARSQKQPAPPPPATQPEMVPEPEPAPPPPPPPPPAPPHEEASVAPPPPEKTTSEPLTLDEEPDLPPPITPPEEPGKPAPAYALDEAPPPPPPPPPRRGGGVTSILLKLTSLATLGLTGYWIYQNPMADVMQIGLAAVAGLGAALLEWHVSDL